MAIDRDNFKRASSVDFGDWLTSAAQAMQPVQPVPMAPKKDAVPTLAPRLDIRVKPLPSGSLLVAKKATQPTSMRSHTSAAIHAKPVAAQAAHPLPPKPHALPRMEGIVTKKAPSLSPKVTPVVQVSSSVPHLAQARLRTERLPQSKPKAAVSHAITQKNPRIASPFDHSYAAPDAEPLPVIADTSDESSFLQLRSSKKRSLGYVLWPIGMVSLFALSFGLAGITSPRGMQRANGTPQVQGAKTVVAEQSKTASGSEISLNTSGVSAVSVGQATSASTTIPAAQQRKSVLKGVEVVVTTQPLPSSYNGDPGSLAQVAKNMGAQESFQSQKWGTVYILTKGSEQAVLCADARQLVIAQVKSKIGTEDWMSYMESI